MRKHKPVSKRTPQPRDEKGRFLSPLFVAPAKPRPKKAPAKKPVVKPVSPKKKVVKQVVKPAPTPKAKPKRKPAPPPVKPVKPALPPDKPKGKPTPVPKSPPKGKPAPAKGIPKSKPGPAPKPAPKSKPTRKRRPKKKRALTTAERREVFYKTLTPEERARLEKRGDLSVRQARAAMAKVINRVTEHYHYMGFSCVPALVVNSDDTIDAEVLVQVVERMVGADSQTLEARTLLHDIPAILGKVDPSIWFSIRLHFQTPEAVDDDGDEAEGSMVFDMVTSNLLEDDYILSEHRWQSLALQTAWQHGRTKVYSNVQGAAAIVTNTLRKNAEQRPVMTFFTYKLAWNPWNITPGKTR